MFYLESANPGLRARFSTAQLESCQDQIQRLLEARISAATQASSLVRYGFDKQGLYQLRGEQRRLLSLTFQAEAEPSSLLALDGQTGQPRHLFQLKTAPELWADVLGSYLIYDPQHLWALQSTSLRSADGRYELWLAGSYVLLIDQQTTELFQLCPHQHEILARLDLSQIGNAEYQQRVYLAADPDAQAFWISNGSQILLRWHPAQGHLSQFELKLGPIGAVALAPDPRYLLLQSGDSYVYSLDTHRLSILKSLELPELKVYGPILLSPQQTHWLVSVQTQSGQTGLIQIGLRDLVPESQQLLTDSAIWPAGFESLNPFAEITPNLDTYLLLLSGLEPESLKLSATADAWVNQGWPVQVIRTYPLKDAFKSGLHQLQMLESDSLGLPGQYLVPLPARSQLLLLNPTAAQALLDKVELLDWGIERPVDVRQLPDQRLLVCDAAGRVCEIGSQGLSWEMGAAQGLVSPVRASWWREAGQEAFLIVDLLGARVLICNREYEISWEYEKGLLSPCDAQMSPRGTIWIADSGRKTVLEIDKHGHLLREFGPELGLSSPMFVREHEGYLLILDAAGASGPTLHRIELQARFESLFSADSTTAFKSWPLSFAAPYFLSWHAPDQLLMLSQDQLLILSGLLEPEPQALVQRTLQQLAPAKASETQIKGLSGSAGRVDFLRSLPLFKFLVRDPAALSALAESLTDLWIKSEQVILTAGEQGEALYLLAAGSVDILTHHGETLLQLTPGDLFGEISLLFSEPRSNTIRANSETRLLRLSKRAFHRLSRNYPQLHRQFEKMARERRTLVQQRRMDALISKHLVRQTQFALDRLRQLEIFAGLDDQILAVLMPHLQLRKLSAGSLVFEQGDVGRELFMISRGQLDVYDQGQLINTLPEGEVFGEIALILDRPRTATVKTRTYSEVYVLDRQSFDLALALSPELKDQFVTLAQQRLERSQSQDYQLTATRLDRKSSLASLSIQVQHGQSSLKTALSILQPNQNQVLSVSPEGKLLWHFGQHDLQQLLAPTTIQHKGHQLLIADQGNHRILLLELESRQLLASCGDQQIQLLNPSCADLDADGNWLIADQGQLRLIKVEVKGSEQKVIWEFKDLDRLLSPVWVEALDNQEVLFVDDVLHQVQRLNSQGQTIWSYGTTLFPGREYFQLNTPRFASYLDNGNLLIADTGNNRLLEVIPDKEMIWQKSDSDLVLKQPQQAWRLSNGHTLVVHDSGAELLEITPDKQSVWRVNLLSDSLKAEI